MSERPEEVMPGFHERDGGMLGEDTKAERYLSTHVAFSAVVILWIFALGEAFIGRRLEAWLTKYELFAAESREKRRHTTATLLMHFIFMPLSILGLGIVPFWAAEIQGAAVVARAVTWIDASFLLLWELRELFFLDLATNLPLVAHHLSTCVIIVAILDFHLLRDITWLQLLFLAANTAWLQRPVTIVAKFVDDRSILHRAHTLGIAGIALDLVQLVCAVWFFVACSAMGNFGAAAVVLGAAIPISYLRLQVNRWVWRFDPAFAIDRQLKKKKHLLEGRLEDGMTPCLVDEASTTTTKEEEDVVDSKEKTTPSSAVVDHHPDEAATTSVE